MGKSKLLILIVIAGWVGLGYLFSFKSEFFLDTRTIFATENYLLKNPFDPGRIFSENKLRFIPLYTLALNYYAGGYEPFGYHVVNLLFHILSAFLVYLITLRLLTLIKKDLKERDRVVAAFLSALVFALHPIQTQSVTYVIQRISVFAGFFMLLSLYFYLRFLDKRSWLFLGISLAGFLAALFSKETAIVFPGVLLLVNGVLGAFKKNIKHVLLYFGLAVLVLGLVYGPAVAVNPPDARHGRTFSRGEYILTQVVVVRDYVRMLLFPVGQGLEHDFEVVRGVDDPRFIFSLGIHLALLTFGVWSFRRNKLIFFGVCFFYINLVVESGLVPIADLFVEHRLYLPTLGFVWVLLGVLTSTAGRKRGLAVMTMGLIVFTGLTVKRNIVWANEQKLLEESAQRGGNSPRPLLWLADFYQSQAKHQEARELYLKAIDLSDRRQEEIMVKVGLTYAGEGDYGQAIDWYEKSLEIEESGEAISNIGVAYLRKGDKDSAEKYFRKAVDTEGTVTGYLNLAGIVVAREGLGAVRELYIEAVERNPDSLLMMLGLAEVESRLGNWEDARKIWEAVLYKDIRNPEAELGIGRYYLVKGDTEKSEKWVGRALRHGGDWAITHRVIAEIKMAEFDEYKQETGLKYNYFLEEAGEALALALHMDSSDGSIWRTAGELNIRRENFELAADALEVAIQKDPSDEKSQELLEKIENK